MKPRSVEIIPGSPSTRNELVRRLPLPTGLLAIGLGLILATTAFSFSGSSAAPQDASNSTIPGVKSVIGLENIKPGTTGTLISLPTGLQFSTGKAKANIAMPSIQDVFTGQESRQDVTGVGGTLVEAAIPYGGGRFVSLFSHKVDVLTVEYVDSNGGFHGAIFVLSVGKATAVRNQLITQGAKATIHVEAPEPKEQKQ